MEGISPLKTKVFWKIYLNCLFISLSVSLITSVFVFYLLQFFNIVGTYRSVVVLIILGSCLFLISGWIFVKHVIEPILEMKLVCDAFRYRNYDQKITRLPNNEIGLLGNSLNKLGSDMTSQILKISQERLQLTTMLKAVVDGIISVDEEDRVIFYNHAAKKLLQAEFYQAIGSKIYHIDGFKILMKIIQCVRQEQASIQEEIIVGNEPNENILEINANFFINTQSSGVIITLHNLTNIRRLERIRQDFVANVSHEIKTPLTSLKGYVETLLAGAIDDPKNKLRFLKKIEKNTARLISIVRDILSLARIESNEDIIQSESVDLILVIKRVMDSYEDMLKDNGSHYKLEAQEVSLCVFADEDTLKHVLENLLSNAIRYTQPGGNILIRVYTQDTWGVFVVEDTGVGVPKQDLERIFERFYRVDAGRSRKLGGTGLGLSIVKHYVARMKGKIHVKSRLNIGSQFFVYIPIHPPKQKL